MAGGSGLVVGAGLSNFARGFTNVFLQKQQQEAEHNAKMQSVILEAGMKDPMLAQSDGYQQTVKKLFGKEAEHVQTLLSHTTAAHLLAGAGGLGGSLVPEAGAGAGQGAGAPVEQQALAPQTPQSVSQTLAGVQRQLPVSATTDVGGVRLTGGKPEVSEDEKERAFNARVQYWRDHPQNSISDPVSREMNAKQAALHEIDPGMIPKRELAYQDKILAAHQLAQEHLNETKKATAVREAIKAKYRKPDKPGKADQPLLGESAKWGLVDPKTGEVDPTVKPPSTMTPTQAAKAGYQPVDPRSSTTAFGRFFGASPQRVAAPAAAGTTTTPTSTPTQSSATLPKGFSLVQQQP